MLSSLFIKFIEKAGIRSAYRFFRLNKKRSDKNTIKIVFMCQLPHIWSSIESIYEEAVKDKAVDAYVLAIPNEWDEKVDTEAYEFCLANGYKTINAYDKDTALFFDLESFEPDYIFYPRPYDVLLPEQYRSDIVSKYSKICYVCYGYVAEGGHILETCYSKWFTRNSYFVFPDNASTEEYCKKNHPISYAMGLRKIKRVAFPRFDLVEKFMGKEPDFWKKNREDVNKRIIWTPRWTTDEKVGGTNFFEYKEFFFEFADVHKDCEFMIRPHPLAFQYFIDNEIMSEKEVESYKARCKNSTNIQLDERKNYIDSFASADILVSDMSGVMADFLVTGKPLVFCSYKQEFNEANMKLLEAFYIPHNVDELEEILKMLISGNDPKKWERERIVKEVLGECDGMNGHRILEYLKEDSKI